MYLTWTKKSQDLVSVVGTMYVKSYFCWYRVKGNISAACGWVSHYLRSFKILQSELAALNHDRRIVLIETYWDTCRQRQ